MLRACTPENLTLHLHKLALAEKMPRRVPLPNLRILLTPTLWISGQCTSLINLKRPDMIDSLYLGHNTPR